MPQSNLKPIARSKVSSKRHLSVGGLLLLIMGGLLAACDRARLEPSYLSISLPNSQALKTLGSGEPNHFILNISDANNQKRIFCSYDVNWKNAAGPCDFSQASEILVRDVPVGANQLIQIGLAYEGSTGMSLYHGFKRMDISPGTPGSVATVAIDNFEKLGSGAGSGASLRGRIFNTLNSGPTGILTSEIEIPNGLPGLLLDISEVFSGWFRTFALDGIRFSYVINGIQRFGAPMMYSDFLTSSLGRIVKGHTGSDGHGDLVGFFGPGVTGREVKDYGTSCDAASAYGSCLDISGTNFVGPFKQASGSTLSVNSSTKQISWIYLPGVAEPNQDEGGTFAVEGVEVFVYPDKNDSTLQGRVGRGENKVDCEAVRGLPGTQSLGRVAAPTNSISIPDALVSGVGQSAIFVCPYRGMQFYKTVAANISLGGHGGGSGSGPYYRIEGFEGSGNNHFLTKGDCREVTVKTFAPCSQGEQCSPHALTASLTFTLTSYSSGADTIRFFSEGTCSTVLASVSIAQNSSESSILYIKSTTGSNLPSHLPISSMIAVPANSEVHLGMQNDEIALVP